MRVKIKDNIRIIENHSDGINEILVKIENQINNFLDTSLILNLTYNKELSIKDLNHFKEINKTFKKHQLSFVLVNDTLNLTDLKSDIHVVPTVLEAHDIIQLDNIQRELGF